MECMYGRCMYYICIELLRQYSAKPQGQSDSTRNIKDVMMHRRALRPAREDARGACGPSASPLRAPLSPGDLRRPGDLWGARGGGGGPRGPATPSN